MKKLLLKILLVIDVLAIIIYGVCSYLLIRYDAVAGVMTDGFGRVLVPTPVFFRWYLGIGKWVGLGWFVIDTIGFWMSVYIATLLYKRIKGNK